MFLANLDATQHRAQIEAIARHILSRQNNNGSWDYDHRSAGDTSISQYALLGLWEAENAGVQIPPSVWDRAAAWYIAAQFPDGSWNYHRDEIQWKPTVAMTAAGVGSLFICERQLYQKTEEAEKPESRLLNPLVSETGGPAYTPKTSKAAINSAVRKGITWLSRNFVVGDLPIVGQSPYYSLYGLERVGALAGRDTLGGVDWFGRGMQYLLTGQEPSGAWNAQYGEVVNTAWGILFLTKSTTKTLQKIEIKRLGSGTLVGGRGLPKDLSSLTVAGGRVLVRPMNGAIEGMFAALEDPRGESAQEALAGLVQRYQTEGPEVLKKHKERLIKLMEDPDPGIRSVAAWGLGRAGDLDAVPILIALLEDPDEQVVAAARTSLQLLSRKLDGFGPPPDASLAERRAAAQRWHAWYEEVRQGDPFSSP